MPDLRVALAPFLRFCPAVTTLGVRACLDDYTEREKELLHSASRIFFPTPRYAGTFEAAGKSTFPCSASYLFQRSRLHQELLLQVLDLPHPKTRIYFGRRQKSRIPFEFSFPFLAMGPHAPSDSVHLVEGMQALGTLLERYNPLIIKDYTGNMERFRFIFVEFECAGIQKYEPGQPDAESWRPADTSSGTIRQISDRTAEIVRRLGINDISIEWSLTARKWLVAGMTRPPVRWSSPSGKIERFEYVAHLIRRGML